MNSAVTFAFADADSSVLCRHLIGVAGLFKSLICEPVPWDLVDLKEIAFSRVGGRELSLSHQFVGMRVGGGGYQA